MLEMLRGGRQSSGRAAVGAEERTKCMIDKGMSVFKSNAFALIGIMRQRQLTADICG